MAPNSSRWWMTAVSSKKLCLYSDKGCRGQIMDMDKATDADMVKITLHDGSVRLLSVKRFVPSHEEGCSTFRGISTAATLTETWSQYSGKFIHVPAADQEALDSDVHIADRPNTTFKVTKRIVMDTCRPEDKIVIHVPAADQEALDSDVHIADRPNTTFKVTKRIVMDTCRPEDKIVFVCIPQYLNMCTH
ncbi:uncharacterized protein LOC125381982 [Haliotis rufescens]|uniref:uncharacterized protein LOC125381982 n=1 Tax=Haliotis rufescens TaxID=6454 RepID=UPI00201F7966|nr:uncharacterized protein LOC125381982 [Haliotis rufescens]